MNKDKSTSTSGFTLVELSMVIVIIGLIFAGVVGGQSLIKTSKMNAQILDLNKFETAYNTFKLEYNSIPGDMRNASSYWAGSTNGDGNGRITQVADDGFLTSNENIKFFEHLSRAKLLPETYTNTMTLGVGYPSLKLNSSKGMTAGASIRPGNSGSEHQLSNNNVMLRYVAAIFLHVSNPSGVWANQFEFNDYTGIASPLTLSTIDRKIDDGVATNGKFKAYRTWGSILGNCLTGDDGDYFLTETRENCMGVFIIDK
jgi:prepilin-type N-terminal cleavage/methylation domain-containing protein